MTKKEQTINTIIGSYFIKRSSLQLQKDIKDFEEIVGDLSYSDNIQIMSHIKSCIDNAQGFRDKIEHNIEEKLN